MQKMAHSSDYFLALMTVVDIIYDEVVTYFIHHSPKSLVASNVKIDHVTIKEKCIQRIKYSPFSRPIPEVVAILYATLFGENGCHLDTYVYQTKGHGWCKRVFPPTDSEMYTYIVERVTTETKQQYKKMCVL